jgi:hypothetical protein
MNRLIIIGNGFDLAHKLETSYNDFVLSYLKQSLISALDDLRVNNERPYNNFYYYKDELIEIKIDYRNAKESYIPIIDNIKKVSELEGLYTKLGIEVSYYFGVLKKGVAKIKEYNWVDFELEYFKELILIKFKKVDVNNKIQELNTHFEFFKKKLEAYLKKEQNECANEFDKQAFISCFREEILEKDVDFKTIGSHFPNRLLFLNFNYTNTLEPYVTDCNEHIFSEINYIHGSVNDENNPPIFGFGDEFDKRYKEFEDEGNNELFKHIKSFGYLKTNNYSNLTRFLDSDKFQVQIFGHSCGLSDRTMFKEIFEHENCLSIKLFYHLKEDGSDDYTEKTYELYRHFSDKNSMRKKIVDKQKCRPMPQPLIDVIAK